MLNTTKQQKGFSIIEVLIVLAIGGLIMLIVFMAVPALQRNSRNTQRRSDVSTYAGAVNEFISNNNGNLPTTAAHAVSINALANLGALTEPTSAPATNAQSSVVTVDNLQLVTSAKCDTANVGNTILGPKRSFAIRYAVENSSGDPVPQCQEG